jgi:competence protein ComEA
VDLKDLVSKYARSAAILSVAAVATVLFGMSRSAPPKPIVLRQSALVPTNSSPPAAKTVVVQVAGAVKNPGVFKVPIDSRVNDAIRLAGGPKPNANLDEWNLAAKVIDGSQIFVNSKSASNAPGVRSPRQRKPHALSGVPPLHVEVPESLRGGLGAASAYSDARAIPDRKSSSGAKKEMPAEGSISINTGSIADLDRLPGVGPSTAQKIIDYRSEHGGFTAIDELLAVRGIGPKKLEAMRKYVRL